MNITALLQGVPLVLLAGLLVVAGAAVHQLHRLASDVHESREARFESQLRRRLRAEGFSEAEATDAIEDSKGS